MELFQTIPERFFSVLASPSRSVYAYVLFLIYDLHRLELYGTPREAVVDAVEAHLETEELDDEELGETASLTPREKAGAMLRRLQETGWLEIEQRADYQQYVNLADYAIRILDTLDRIRKQERLEYAGFVLATYVALTSEEAERNPGLVISKAYDQTQQLVRDLKALHDNIKRYTERLLQQKEPREILAMHFGDYKLEVLDRSYHRLKTTDNVSKYRPRILERIESWLSTSGWLENAAADEVRRGRHPAQDAAVEALLTQLRYIQHSYERMDDLLDEIDRRNAQYAKASLEHVRYLLSSGEDIEGRLIALLQALGAQMRIGALAPDEPCPDAWQAIFDLQATQTWEESSLFTPRQTRRAMQPQDLDLHTATVAQRSLARRQLRDRLAARMTYRRIDEYVAACLGDQNEITARELAVSDTDDYVRLIYVAAYGRSRQVRYKVEYAGDRLQSQGGRYSFRNIRIKRK